MYTVSQTEQRLHEIVIFGGVGDLSLRKLLPALYMAHVHGTLPAGTRIHALGRQVLPPEQFKSFVDEKCRPFIQEEHFDHATWAVFVQALNYVAMDASKDADYQALSRSLQPGSLKIYYLATSPSLFRDITSHLHGAGLVDPSSRVVLEKPLGNDLVSAQAINDHVAQYFKESQVYRIDHYLGKETVQNLMVLRFGNRIFEPLWRGPHIKSVQITVAEAVGVGSRAGFYDETGAMRDMVQNHLLQLLCIVAMEPPVSLDPDAVRDEKLKVLKSLRPMDMAAVATDTVRGQYMAGAVEGQSVSGYLGEENVPANSNTETFVAIKAHLNNWRWANVPFFLRTGKRMQQRHSEIVIEFAAYVDAATGTQRERQIPGH